MTNWDTEFEIHNRSNTLKAHRYFSPLKGPRNWEEKTNNLKENLQFIEKGRQRVLTYEKVFITTSMNIKTTLRWHCSPSRLADLPIASWGRKSVRVFYVGMQTRPNFLTGILAKPDKIAIWIPFLHFFS